MCIRAQILSVVLLIDKLQLRIFKKKTKKTPPAYDVSNTAGHTIHTYYEHTCLLYQEFCGLSIVPCPHMLIFWWLTSVPEPRAMQYGHTF